jgi:hypothetical protein
VRACACFLQLFIYDSSDLMAWDLTSMRSIVSGRCHSPFSSVASIRCCLACCRSSVFPGIAMPSCRLSSVCVSCERGSGQCAFERFIDDSLWLVALALPCCQSFARVRSFCVGALLMEWWSSLLDFQLATKLDATYNVRHLGYSDKHRPNELLACSGLLAAEDG